MACRSLILAAAHLELYQGFCCTGFLTPRRVKGHCHSRSNPQLSAEDLTADIRWAKAPSTSSDTRLSWNCDSMLSTAAWQAAVKGLCFLG